MADERIEHDDDDDSFARFNIGTLRSSAARWDLR
jgi:hypothetical protein